MKTKNDMEKLNEEARRKAKNHLTKGVQTVVYAEFEKIDGYKIWEGKGTHAPETRFAVYRLWGWSSENFANAECGFHRPRVWERRTMPHAAKH